VHQGTTLLKDEKFEKDVEYGKKQLLLTVVIQIWPCGVMGSAVEVLVLIQYSVLAVRTGYTRSAEA